MEEVGLVAVGFRGEWIREVERGIRIVGKRRSGDIQSSSMVEMEDSTGRRVDEGEVEIDRGRGVVRAVRERETERERERNPCNCGTGWEDLQWAGRRGEIWNEHSVAGEGRNGSGRRGRKRGKQGGRAGVRWEFHQAGPEIPQRGEGSREEFADAMGWRRISVHLGNIKNGGGQKIGKSGGI